MSQERGATIERMAAALAAITQAANQAALLQAAAELVEALEALLASAAISPAEVMAARAQRRAGQSQNGHAQSQLLPDSAGRALTAPALVEALLFVAPEPLELETLARLLQLDLERAAAVVEELDQSLRTRGIRIQRAGSRLQLTSAPEAAAQVEQLLGVQISTRLSAAALETLAIIAYRQPVTRGQIEAIRGVDSSGVVRALLARGLIAESGRAESVGRPILYVTTPEFLNQFGLQSLAELPPMQLPEPKQEDARPNRSEESAGTTD